MHKWQPCRAFHVKECGSSVVKNSRTEFRVKKKLHQCLFTTTMPPERPEKCRKPRERKPYKSKPSPKPKTTDPSEGHNHKTSAKPKNVGRKNLMLADWMMVFAVRILTRTFLFWPYEVIHSLSYTIPTQHGHLTMEDYLSFPFSFLLYSFVFHFPLILLLLITCFFPQIVGSQQDDILSSLTLDHSLSQSLEASITFP